MKIPEGHEEIIDPMQHLVCSLLSRKVVFIAPITNRMRKGTIVGIERKKARVRDRKGFTYTVLWENVFYEPNYKAGL